MAPKIKAKQSAKAKAKPKAKPSAASAVPRNGKAPRAPKKSNIANVFEADDDDQVMRRSHTLDSVETYEYQDGKIGQEDDEDIDSDEAFDESDEEKFENFKFFGSTKRSDKKLAKSKRSGNNDGEISLDENDNDEEEEDEDEDGEDFMDISEMFNHEGESSKKAVPKKEIDKKKARFAQLLPDSDDEEDEFGAVDNEIMEYDEEDGEYEENEEVEGDDKDVDKTEELASFIGSLEKKRKRDINDASERKRRGTIKERTEAYAESEFNLPARDSASASGAKKKLDLKDLVGTLQDETGLSGLKKKLQALESKGKGAQEPLTAPLPKRIQDRLNRQAAYEETKKEVTKWQPIVKANREADHLAFPMNEAPPVKMTNAGLANKFEATNDLEKQIQAMLEDSGLKEKDLKEFEELAMSKLSVEEIAARRKEMRMMRELMFRDEIKAKRIAKIKSKAYRKIKKKQREKNSLTTEQLMELDPEMASEERLKAEANRAAERMSLKHKNTGKWAKQMLKHGQHDEGTRQAIMEQLQRGEDLKKKIQGLGSDEEISGEEDDESYSDVEDGDVEAVKRRVADELDQLEQGMKDDDEDGRTKKGVFAMKFMQDAAKRQREENRVMLKDLKGELDLDVSSESEEEDRTGQSKKKKKQIEENFALVGKNPGRMMFGLNAKQLQLGKLPEQDTSTNEPLLALNDGGQIKKVAISAAHTTRMSGSVSINGPSKLLTGVQNGHAPSLAKQQGASEEEESNPWLQADTSRMGTQSKKQNKALGRAGEPKSDKLVGKLKKQRGLARDAENGEDVEIDLENVLTLNEATETAKPKQKAKQNDNRNVTTATGAAADDDDNEGSSDQDIVDQQPKMVHAKSALAFSQRELVAQAFANDNVVEEFETEKRLAMEEDTPKEVDLTLPGWGSWGGRGIKKKTNIVVKKPLPGEGVEASKRQDAKLKHVIINEKRIKKATKYQSIKLPHPFKTREQYENSLRTPVGKEWNTTEMFQKMVLPRVTTKLGKVIDPLTAPFK